MASFAANISSFIKKTGIKAETVLKKLAFDGLRGVVMKTPVDTGRCRGSWRVALNQVNLETEVLTDYVKVVNGVEQKSQKGQEATQKAIDEGSKKVNEAKWGHAIYITNNLPYAPALENGHSKQAPAGMLGVTFAELKAAFAATVASIKGL